MKRNFYAKFLKRFKKEFYINLNAKTITDNKCFWKSVKPNLNDKTLKCEKIILVEDDRI